MYEHNALGYWSGLTLCLTKVRSSQARCPATALIEMSFNPIISDASKKIKILIHVYENKGTVQLFANLVCGHEL